MSSTDAGAYKQFMILVVLLCHMPPDVVRSEASIQKLTEQLAELHRASSNRLQPPEASEKFFQAMDAEAGLVNLQGRIGETSQSPVVFQVW